MNDKILKQYLEFSTFTYPGLYGETLRRTLPNDVREIGLLVRKNFVHRTTLAAGNTGTNADLKYGDMTAMPWWRQPEDDVLVTAAAMLAELYRRDDRGFVMDRRTEDKLVLTCRFVSIMTACILKSKGIPCRVRAGHSPYWNVGPFSDDHWINQYWDTAQSRWVTVDVDGSLNVADKFDPYDMPDSTFDFPASIWLGVRSGKLDPNNFRNAKPETGIIAILWSLFYDFHCLMNNEIIYLHSTVYGGYEKSKNLTEAELDKIDHLARLMVEPDNNFDELKTIWESDRDFRILTGALL